MRAALVAISVWKLTRFSSGVSSSWHCSERPAHAQQRLVREAGRAFGHGVDVDREPQPAQIVQKGRLEQRLPIGAGERRQVRQVVAARSGIAGSNRSRWPGRRPR